MLQNTYARNRTSTYIVGSEANKDFGDHAEGVSGRTWAYVGKAGTEERGWLQRCSHER